MQKRGKRARSRRKGQQIRRNIHSDGREIHSQSCRLHLCLQSRLRLLFLTPSLLLLLLFLIIHANTAWWRTSRLPQLLSQGELYRRSPGGCCWRSGLVTFMPYTDRPLPCCQGCLASWWQLCGSAVTAVSHRRAGEAVIFALQHCSACISVSPSHESRCSNRVTLSTCSRNFSVCPVVAPGSVPPVSLQTGTTEPCCPRKVQRWSDQVAFL